MSPNGRLLASSSEDGTVRLWEGPTARLVATLKWHDSGVVGVARSRGGQLRGSGRGGEWGWADAGQRQRGWDGAAVGGEFRAAARHAARPHRPGPGRGAECGRSAAGQLQRGWDGAAVGDPLREPGGSL